MQVPRKASYAFKDPRYFIYYNGSKHNIVFYVGEGGGASGKM
jgi:hypothetical protein